MSSRFSLTACVLPIVLVASWANACASGPSRDQVMRSEREYDLGVGLWQEKNFAGAFQHLFAAIELDSDNAEAHLLLGNLFLFRRDWDRAEHHLSEALRANRVLGNGGRASLNAEAQNSLGVLYLHREKADRAVQVLTDATKDLLNRTPHLAWGNLGWAYYRQGKHSKAAEALTQAVNLQDKFCLGYFRLGRVKLAQGKVEDADGALTRALEVDDDACQALQDAWKLRGEVRARLGKRDDALLDFERCVELGPESEVGKGCQGLLNGN